MMNHSVVIVHIIMMEVHVRRVLHENIVQHDQQVVVVVQTNHQIHHIQVMRVQIVVVGLVIVRTIRMEIHVHHVV